MRFEKLLNNNRNDVAFIIGNGVNQYEKPDISWKKILITIWNKYNHGEKIDIPTGISLCEFSDVLDIGILKGATRPKIQEEFCNEVKNWMPSPTHHRIVNWAKINNIPILTTNFDETLSKASNCIFYRKPHEKFTDYYPWECYFSDFELLRPLDGFAIWHINGMQRYHRSLRLGLSHYMGSVERVRNWLHKGNEKALFSGKDKHNWQGANSWVHIIFNKPLIIFGLGLDYNEVFLRWLLIERRKYFIKFPQREKPAWYIHPKNEKDSGKYFFLRGIGIEILSVKSFDEIYLSPW